MRPILWKLIDIIVIFIFFELVENYLYIFLACLVRVKLCFTDFKKVM